MEKDAGQLLEAGTYNPRDGQQLWWTYYDRAVMAAAVLNHALFTVPLGQAGKNLSDTNLTVAGEIPKGQNFEVQFLEVKYIEDAAKTHAQYQNVKDMFRDSTLEFIINGKSPQLQINMALLMGAAMDSIILGAGVGDQASAKSKYTGVYDLPVPIILAAKTNFRVELNHSVAVNASLADDEVYISLIGRLISLQ